MVFVLKSFVEHRVSLVLGHARVDCWLVVSQKDEFHWTSPLVVGQRRNPALDCSPIVVARTKNRQHSPFFYFNSRSRPARKRRSGSCPANASAFSYEARASANHPSLRHRSAR